MLNVSVDGDQVLLQRMELRQVVSAAYGARGPPTGLNSQQANFSDGRVKSLNVWWQPGVSCLRALCESWVMAFSARWMKM